MDAKRGQDGLSRDSTHPSSIARRRAQTPTRNGTYGTPSYLLCAALRKNVDPHANSPVLKRKLSQVNAAKSRSAARDRLATRETASRGMPRVRSRKGWARSRVVDAASTDRDAVFRCASGGMGVKCREDKLRGQMRCSAVAWFQRWTQSWIRGAHG
ncbi:hypothetical protein FA95DRAFT_1003402 [Auriscalpium vulgare]|uniref:Uncharacterized protein n=1 Tax=Auriscalpium vulgare TaxID=40419 RepID=A0ACB8R681_9AGAM|nr:hypothetical protein FA95DRAFT_1003402 [Auriscalpium vulgare]